MILQVNGVDVRAPFDVERVNITGASGVSIAQRVVPGDKRIDVNLSAVPGAIDHGGLTGLLDHDHTQYLRSKENFADIDDVAVARTNLGLVQTPTLFKSLSADASGVGTAATLEPWFPTNGSVTLTANKTYRFEGMLVVYRDNTGSLSLGFGGTAVVDMLAFAIGQTAAVATNGTAQTSHWVDITSLATPAAVVVAPSGNYSWAYVHGTVRVGTGGTLRPMFTVSITSTAAPTIYKNSYFALYEIGADTVTERGTWS